MMKMKLNKKIAGATAMLMLSATMLGTSTFAWFTMNTTVQVTGMQISAHSNSTYLIIGSDDDGNDTLAELQAANHTTTACTIDTDDALVYPSAHGSVANTSAAETPSSWYFKVADLPTASASSGAETPLTSTNFGDYVLHKKAYVTLSVGSQDATNLVVSGMTIASNSTASGSSPVITPVKVLITSANAAVELDSTTLSSATPLAATVTASSVVPLDIWIYYNGNDTNVYTTNIANLDGATVDLEFSVTYASDLPPVTPTP